MFSIISLFITLILSLCMAFAVVWLSGLYIKNHSYVRDIYMILMGVMNILWNTMFCHFLYRFDTKVFGMMIPLALIQFLLMNLFILANIKTSKVKWFSNIFSSIEFIMIIYSCCYKNLIFSHTCLIVISVLTFIFMIMNNNSVLNKFFYIFLVFSIFASTYIINLYITGYKLNNLLIILVFTINNLFALEYIFYRIGLLKQTLGLPSIREKFKKKKEEK